ncbi:MAG: hypothetical protein KDK78_08230, partial [Chlamydiia bacterium]|nr:hypothetical protein [Chlamydiia bacterium]
FTIKRQLLHPDCYIASPRFWEQPDAIQSLAGRLLDGSASPLQREQRRQRKSALLDRMLKKHWWYRRLRPYLEENARLIFYRERTQHLLYRQVDSLRRIAMGKGLGEEVFFLHCDEVDAPPPQSVVRERRKRYVQERSQPAPTTFVAHSPKPAPPTVRTEGLHGLPISQGVYEGNAYIAESLEHALQMPEGSVLLVQHVDPAWSPVLYLAGAIVCEQGGLFCHSSILIRELGIPAVAKVPHACTSVHNGARVRVDGTSGFVSIIESKIPS